MIGISGMYVSVADGLPTLTDPKHIITDKGCWGLACYVDGKWHHLVSTMGEVAKWYKNSDRNGNETVIDLE
jgi:hypothetical protein